MCGKKSADNTDRETGSQNDRERHRETGNQRSREVERSRGREGGCYTKQVYWQSSILVALPDRDLLARCWE